MRNERSYNGVMMTIGRANEEIILEWLQSKYAKEILDFREFRLAQRMDVDFGIETIDGKIVLAEIKSDKWIKEDGNLLFECNRINHFAKNNWFYLGWGWRSPAQNLIVRNPNSGDTFIFDFLELRKFIGSYISKVGYKLRTNITETDEQKTTFNYLIPFSEIKKSLYYKKFIIEKSNHKLEFAFDSP